MISQPQSTSLSTVQLKQAESTPKRITNISYFTATVKPQLSTDTNTTIYFITPTYSRITQKVDLTTLCQTLMLVPKLIWIVVEDSPNKTPMVTNLLTRCNVMSVHMNVESPDTLAIEQRYLGLKVGGMYVEGPYCANGKTNQWRRGWGRRSLEAGPAEFKNMQFNSLLNSCSLADKARLLAVSSPHASAWISVVPSFSSGLHLDSNEFQTAVKWWLGVNPSLNLDRNPKVCPLCPNCALDPLGYHCVTCKRGGDITTRHSHSSQCGVQHLPASCAPRSWLWMGTRQFQDTNSRHPCHPIGIVGLQLPLTLLLHPHLIQLLEAGMYQGVSAKPAEHRKHTENDLKCVELGWQCILLAEESYGAWGPEALKAFSQVATRFTIRDNTPKSKMQSVLSLSSLHQSLRNPFLVAIKWFRGLTMCTMPRDILVETCHQVHIGVKVEVGNNLSRDHKAGVLATAAAQATESRKHHANDPKCSDLGWWRVRQQQADTPASNKYISWAGLAVAGGKVVANLYPHSNVGTATHFHNAVTKSVVPDDRVHFQGIRNTENPLRFRLSRPYSSDRTADLGLDDVMARREARLENDSIASFPHAPYDSTTRGIHNQPNSLHFTSLASCFLSSVACAAAPAVTPASDIMFEFSGEVTDMSQAAVFPRTQLEMRTSAGREWL
eukprot:Em0004g1326a